MIRIQPITPETSATFKAVRLLALQDTPSAFCSTHAKESLLTDAQWAERAARCGGDPAAGFLAMDGPVGCGLIRGSPDGGGDSSVAWVESMWVAPSHRRAGVGRLLIDAVAAWGRARGVRTLKLNVTSSNAQAIGFYERLGFARTGKTAPYANDPAVEEWEMERALA